MRSPPWVTPTRTHPPSIPARGCCLVHLPAEFSQSKHGGSGQREHQSADLVHRKAAAGRRAAARFYRGRFHHAEVRSGRGAPQLSMGLREGRGGPQRRHRGAGEPSGLGV